jgi:protein-tyrosine phosphatase
MFGLFATSQPIPRIGQVLKTDLHAHWLPYLDDGAVDLEASLNMLKQYATLGYEKVIATPHVYQDYYPNSQESILASFEQVRKEVLARKIPLALHCAAEYYLDDQFEALLDKKALLSLGSGQVLVEQSFFAEHPDIEKIFFSMQLKGYQPVLAHVERYGYYTTQLKKLQYWREKGILLQVNLGSLMGKYGPEVQKQAESLVKKGLVDYFASDAHKVEDLKALESFKIKDPKVLQSINL